MLASFWTGLGDKLADRWLTAVLSPAFLFWAGGLLAWTFDREDGRLTASGIERTVERLTGHADGTSASEIAVLVGALLLVVVSGVVVQNLSLPALRFLEGYWPRPLAPLGRLLTGLRSRRLDVARAKWGALEGERRRRPLSAVERDRHSRLERRLRSTPPKPESRMPTRLGNVLRAAEGRPGDRYGLDAVVCWSRLWMLLPENVRGDVSASRRVLDLAAQIWLWGMLFVVWSVFAWWAAVVGLLVAAAAYAWALGAAATFGDLVLAAYDLHRRSLYAALRWPLPASPAAEPEAGRLLTQYLSRGSPAGTPVFTDAAAADAPAPPSAEQAERAG